VGALVHRSGEVDYVIVGTATGLMLPDIGRLRAAQGRFRALRLVHTHLFGEPLSRDDITDLTRLRLDLVSAVVLSPEGEPRAMAWAYNVPRGERGGEPFETSGLVPYGQPQPNFGELISALEREFEQHSRLREVRGKDGRAILVHVGEKGGRVPRTAPTRAWPSSRVWPRPRAWRSTGHSAPRAHRSQVRARKRQLESGDARHRARRRNPDLRSGSVSAQATAINDRTDLRVIDRSQLILDICAARKSMTASSGWSSRSSVCAAAPGPGTTRSAA
jgi:GTP-binding protein HflX